MFIICQGEKIICLWQKKLDLLGFVNVKLMSGVANFGVVGIIFVVISIFERVEWHIWIR